MNTHQYSTAMVATDAANGGTARVSGVMIRPLLEVAAQRGLNPSQFLQDFAIDAASLDSAESALSLHAYQSILDRAVVLTGDPALGLHCASEASEASFGLIGHLMPHAPTLRHAIALTRRFSRLLGSDGQLRLSENNQGARLTFELPRDHVLGLSLEEFLIAAAARFLRMYGGTRNDIRAVSFVCSRPSHGREHERVLGQRPRYAQAFTGLDFDRCLLDRAHRLHHPELYALMRNQAEVKLERVNRPQTLVEQLQEVLRLQPMCWARAPNMLEVARALRLSVRSLRRRLAEEGCSYRELMQSALEARSQELLRDPELTLQQVADALGFSDSTSFHRSFKRRTGETPAHYRARNVGAARVSP